MLLYELLLADLVEWFLVLQPVEIPFELGHFVAPVMFPVVNLIECIEYMLPLVPGVLLPPVSELLPGAALLEFPVVLLPLLDEEHMAFEPGLVVPDPPHELIGLPVLVPLLRVPLDERVE